MIRRLACLLMPLRVMVSAAVASSLARAPRRSVQEHLVFDALGYGDPRRSEPRQPPELQANRSGSRTRQQRPRVVQPAYMYPSAARQYPLPGK
jgi:hypothetical protein